MTSQPAVQTVEVTKVIPRKALASQIYKVTSTNTSEPISSTPQEPLSDLDAAYYNDIIAITQYYTFLGQGLYQEAYQLLSPSAKAYSLEDYAKCQSAAF